MLEPTGCWLQAWDVYVYLTDTGCLDLVYELNENHDESEETLGWGLGYKSMW
jgi:hypothetical protein